MARVELDIGHAHGKVAIDGTEIKGVRAVNFNAEAGSIPTVTLDVYAIDDKIAIDGADVTINQTLFYSARDLQSACSLLIDEYRHGADFRKAIIDSIADVTADYGLSERIADRLFDMETVYADSKD